MVSATVLTVRCTGTKKKPHDPEVIARMRLVGMDQLLMVLPPLPNNIAAGRYFRHKWPCPVATCCRNIEATEDKVLTAAKTILGFGVSDVDASTLERMVKAPS